MNIFFLFLKVCCVVLLVSTVSAGLVYPPESEANVLRSTAEIYPDGAYEYGYETSNGISASEQGIAGKAVQGQAKWTSPEGEAVELTYVADENGYQPQGSHLPVAPPIPDYILRALAWIQAHPPQDDQFSYKNYENQQQNSNNRQSTFQSRAPPPPPPPRGRAQPQARPSAAFNQQNQFNNQNSFNSKRTSVFG